MNSSNSMSVIWYLVSSNFLASSSPTGYLGCGFSALAALRTISATTALGCEPFDITVLDFS